MIMGAPSLTSWDMTTPTNVPALWQANEPSRVIGPLIPRIARHDMNLASQLRRCATSVVLNIAEGEYSDPGKG